MSRNDLDSDNVKPDYSHYDRSAGFRCNHEHGLVSSESGACGLSLRLVGLSRLRLIPAAAVCGDRDRDLDGR